MGSDDSFRYAAYLLRLWQEDERIAWRASLENPHSGDRYHFANLDALCRFILHEHDAPSRATQAKNSYFPRRTTMLTDLQRRKLTRLFHVYDMDGNGYLEVEDYERIARNFCRIHGWQPDSAGYRMMHDSQAQQWQAIQALADSDQDGRVSLEEYLTAYSALPDPDAFYLATVQAIVDFTFDHFDRDGDGYMTAVEFAEVYAVFDLAAEDAHRAFTRMDVDGDGRISKDEGLRLAREFYLSDDPNADGNIFFGTYDV